MKKNHAVQWPVQARKLASIMAISLLCSCTTIATMTGSDTQSLNMQAQQEYSNLMNKAMQSHSLITSGPDFDLANRVLSRLEPVADQANQTGVPFQWRLAVLQSDEINAWVMPGGLVGVYTGIIDRLKLTEPEMAAVLGHEMTHALEEHSKEKAGENVLTGLASNALNVYAGNLAGRAFGAFSQLGIGLPYSRHLETRADLGGLMLMARAGYDPHAALSLWKKMASLKGQANEGGLAKYLSDHPDDTDRQNMIQAELPKAMAAYEQARHN